jgi:hypothetical protein
VDVTVKENAVELKSDKFLGLTKSEVITEEGTEYEPALAVEPDEELLKAFETLAPFVTVLYDYDSERSYSNARIVFNVNYHKFKVACPFCGREQEYVIYTIPYAYPDHWRGCGAKVSSDCGDFSDIYETIANLYSTEELPEVVEKDDAVKTRDGKVVAKIVERDEDEVVPTHTWVIFVKS